MHLFWAQGYGDTSIEDIVESTGVSRYGLYNVFGSKRELFIKALRRYADRMIREAFEGLTKPDASLDAITRGFTYGLTNRATDEARRGCLFCNAATEVAPHDEFIAAAIREKYNELAGLFQNALENAKEKGEVRPELDARATAFYLVGVLQALAVMARVGVNRKQSTEFIETALATLV